MICTLDNRRKLDRLRKGKHVVAPEHGHAEAHNEQVHTSDEHSDMKEKEAQSKGTETSNNIGIAYTDEHMTLADVYGSAKIINNLSSAITYVSSKSSKQSAIVAPAPIVERSTKISSQSEQIAIEDQRLTELL